MRPHVLLHDIGLGVSPPRCPPPVPRRARSACVSLLRFSGYVFVVNMLGVHTAALVILGRFSHTLYLSYTVTYGLATYLGLTFIPVIGRAPLDNMCASPLQRCCCHAPISPPPPLTSSPPQGAHGPPVRVLRNPALGGASRPRARARSAGS